jgi:CDP-diacylglycerol--glycerol-3-phosphate 3-phosphatidyltransferase
MIWFPFHPHGQSIDPAGRAKTQAAGEVNYHREIADCKRGPARAHVGPHLPGPYNRPESMFRHVPNLLTGARLLLAAVFFVMLGYYQHEGRGDPTLLNGAFVIYVVALVTDFLDGYLARRWHVEGAFGRVIDPFVDKVLVLGSFVFFAGKNFIIQDQIYRGARAVLVVKTITGIAPWMVVIILSRELLVTSLRGLSEAGGGAFGADLGGKFKMALQSVTILVILIYVNYFERHGVPQRVRDAAAIVRDVLIALTIIVTALSAVSYIRRGVTLFAGRERVAGN